MSRALAAFLLAACASNPTAPSEHPLPGETVPDGASRAPLGTAATGGSSSAVANGDAAQSGAAQPNEPEGPPPGANSLPAVAVRNVGLHVGGGPNDSASKRPFLQAIERHFPEFLRCYQLVGEPGKEGTFGVDLHVPKAGGRAKVEQPRTGLPGDEFRDCMVAAFEKVVFEPIVKPVVISYSVRFYVE